MTQFKVGDKVRTISVKTRTDYANGIQSNRSATVINIDYYAPFGMQYVIKYDEPFYDHGYLVESCRYYDWENGLELR